MYPLRFQPSFRRYIWGGRRLADVLNKPIGDQSAAESWEIVDHGQDQSVVQYGELAGQNLHDLVTQCGADLVGEKVWARINSPKLPVALQQRFPLLLKFLDANRNLSVQVHPDDTMGSRLPTPDLGKTEAWYVLHADPGAKLYAGIKPGVSQSDFETAVEQGSSESLLHQYEPQRGDCVFVEAGTMHAIGAGLLIAEIQQASNTTFRVFDWNRVDEQGVGRELHIEQAMQATHFERGPVNPIPPQVHDAVWSTLVACDQFTMRRGAINEPITIGGDGNCYLLTVTQGEINIAGDPAERPLSLGDTALLPAQLGSCEISPIGDSAEVLLIFV